MRFFADLHIHSKYSRATSPEMDLEHICEWAKLKGLELVGTGDFTHPLWFKELRFKLEPNGQGLYRYRGVNFILSTEVNNIFSKGGRTRKIHTVIMLPSLEAAADLSTHLKKFADLTVDGRPILPIYASRLAELAMNASPECMIVPAHIWTPHFSLFGANSGFDAIEECYEEQTPNLTALETGLSSDPAMNRRLSALDRYALVSNSDAHSPNKLGREANIFDCEMEYGQIRKALTEQGSGFLGTIEYFPEEGKYHYDGHRNCHVRFSPQQTRANAGRCPVCGKKLTVGVMSRVEALADRPAGSKTKDTAGFRHMVPLEETIAAAFEMGTGTQAVSKEYHKLVGHFGNEFTVLLDATVAELSEVTSSKVAEGIMRVRQGKIKLLPGYDGEYGEIRLFESEDKDAGKKRDQLELF